MWQKFWRLVWSHSFWLCAFLCGLRILILSKLMSHLELHIANKKKKKKTHSISLSAIQILFLIMLLGRLFAHQKRHITRAPDWQRSMPHVPLTTLLLLFQDVSHLFTSGSIYPHSHLSALISQMQAILTTGLCSGHIEVSPKRTSLKSHLHK